MKNVIVSIIILWGWGYLSSPLFAQQTAGMSGLMNTPSADFNPDGTFSMGANYLPQRITPKSFNYTTGNYYLNITYFSFLELSYRMTLMRMDKTGNRFTNQDRSMAVRIRVLKESDKIPALVLGSNDFFSSDFTSSLEGKVKKDNQFFGNVYLVTTKNFAFAGKNNIGFTLGYAYQTRKQDNYTGVLAGIRYNPSFYPPLSIITEYDGLNFNMGASALLFKHFYIQAFVSQFDEFSAGIAYRTQLKVGP